MLLLRSKYTDCESKINQPEKIMTTSNELQQNDFWQTQARGSNEQEYQIYVDLADDGKGGDITRDGRPLKTYQEWLSA